MDLKIIDNKGASTSTISASDELFGREYNQSLIHQVIVAYQANGRQGTRAQKGRSDVNKSGKKPFRQKGTGQARAGDAASPLWRGGGKIFPNLPDENFKQKLNRKMYRAGMCSILSQLVREGRLSVVEEFMVDAPKTKMLSEKLKGMGLNSVLVITDIVDQNLELSSRNLNKVAVVDVGHANPVALIRHDKVLITRKAVSKFEEILV